jgi:pyruvate dehydrogenase E1 component
MELPGVTFIEPTYGTALSWMLADAITRVAAGPSELKTAAPYDDGAFYFRLTTRPLDQAPFEAARKRIGDAVLKRQVLSGGYRLFDGICHRIYIFWYLANPCGCPYFHVSLYGGKGLTHVYD